MNAFVLMVHLTTLLSDAGDHANSNPIRSGLSKSQSERPNISNYIVDPSAAYEKRSSHKSTAYSATKLAINMVKESSDAFPPLKSVVGGLSAILNHCDVRSIFRTSYQRCFTPILANSGVSSDDRIVGTPS